MWLDPGPIDTATFLVEDPGLEFQTPPTAWQREVKSNMCAALNKCPHHACSYCFVDACNTSYTKHALTWLACFCRADKVTYVPEHLWRMLVRQFSGGPAVARWVEFSEDMTLEQGEHHGFCVHNADTRASATLYVSGHMRYSRFHSIASTALRVTDDTPMVLCDGDGVDMDAAAEKHGADATLYDVGYMVRIRVSLLRSERCVCVLACCAVVNARALERTVASSS